jgi:hypothetical protein
LRHCAASRKVADSIPDGVIEIFCSHNSSGRTVALGSTHPLTENNTGNTSSGVKSTDLRADNPPTFVPIVLKSGSLNLLEPFGSVQTCNGIAVLLSFTLACTLQTRFVFSIVEYLFIVSFPFYTVRRTNFCNTNLLPTTFPSQFHIITSISFRYFTVLLLGIPLLYASVC